MKAKKNMACLIIASMTLTACGEKTSVVNQFFTTNGSSETLLKNSNGNINKSITLESWKKLVLTKDKNNFALAKLFASQVSASERDEVQKFIDDNLSPEEISKIIERVGKNYDQKKLVHLYHSAPWATDRDLIENSIMRLDEVSTEDLSSLEKQLIIETSVKIKNKFLEDILSTYTQAMESSAIELAANMAADLKVNNPELIANIEIDLVNNKKDAVLEKLKKGLQNLEYFKQIRQDASLSDSELVIAGLSGAIAYKIYDQVKDSKTFRDIKIIIADAKEFKKKIDRATKIVNTIKDLHNSTAKDIGDFKAATSQFSKSSSELFDAVKKDLDKNPDNNITVKKQLEIVYADLFTKKNRSSSTAYESQMREMDKSLVAMSGSFSSMAANFDSIVNNSVLLANSLGIHLGKDAQQIVKYAQTASKFVNLAANTFKGFLAGGYVGASMALVGSASQMLGAGQENAWQSQVSAQLSAMDMKLDDIIKLQKQTIQLQLDTMKMMRDLALMVDDYHQTEMRTLTELKDDNLTTAEISQSLLNHDVRSCESLIEYQLIDINNNKQMYSFRMNDADLMDLTQKDFYGNLKKYQSFESIIGSNYFEGFADCQRGINSAFGKLSADENPILAIYNSNQVNNFNTFQREVYRPLVNELNTVIEDKNTIQLPLHLPTKSMKNLSYKYLLMNKPTTLGDQGYDVYDFKNLVSPVALTRYVSSLLVLYPLLDFDRETWAKGPNAIIEQFFANLYNAKDLENDDYRVYLKTRSLYLLKNALYLTQSSIAQEALLAGEPILNLLYKDKTELFKYDNPCTDANLNNGNLSCALYSNRLLMKNFLLYSVYTSSNSARYTLAYQTEQLAELENVLGGGTNMFSGKVVKVINQEKVSFVLNLKGFKINKIQLPYPEDLKDYSITYSENMVKLLKLQLKLIDAIISVSPQFMTDGLDTKYSALILLNAGK